MNTETHNTAEFDIRQIPAGAERWSFVKGFVTALSGVPHNPVQRNLTDAEVRREGKARGLSLGRPSKAAQWVILNTDAVRADVIAWTAEHNPEHRSECDFVGFAAAHGRA